MNNFMYLMNQIMFLLSYKWTIWGFTFSLFQTLCYAAVADISFTFIAKAFGKYKEEYEW